MATSTVTRKRARSGPAAAAAAPKIDGRMRFNWLEHNRATVIYQGDECLINCGTRKQPFRGASLTAAVNQGIGAMPPHAATPGPGRPKGSRTSGSASRAAGK